MDFSKKYKSTTIYINNIDKKYIIKLDLEYSIAVFLLTATALDIIKKTIDKLDIFKTFGI